VLPAAEHGCCDTSRRAAGKGLLPPARACFCAQTRASGAKTSLPSGGSPTRSGRRRSHRSRPGSPRSPPRSGGRRATGRAASSRVSSGSRRRGSSSGGSSSAATRPGSASSSRSTVAVTTTPSATTTSVARTSSSAGTAKANGENQIKEAKLGLGRDNLPCRGFHANRAYPLLTLLASNLRCWLKPLTLPPSEQTSYPKRLRTPATTPTTTTRRQHRHRPTASKHRRAPNRPHQPRECPIACVGMTEKESRVCEGQDRDRAGR
jgi:hypothetical protein